MLAIKLFFGVDLYENILASEEQTKNPLQQSNSDLNIHSLVNATQLANPSFQFTTQEEMSADMNQSK